MSLVYRVEIESLKEVLKGPFGVFKRKQKVFSPGIIIHEGETAELYNGKGIKVGIAKIMEGILAVKPEGDVSVDFGDIKDFKSSINIADNSQIKGVWDGFIRTRENRVTIKSVDGKQKVHLKRLKRIA